MMLIVAPQPLACIVDASLHPFQLTVAALPSPPFYSANFLLPKALKNWTPSGI